MTVRKRGKIAITIASELFAEAERLRRKARESAARRYVLGYRRLPERPAEIRAALAIALEGLD